MSASVCARVVPRGDACAVELLGAANLWPARHTTQNGSATEHTEVSKKWPRTAVLAELIDLSVCFRILTSSVCVCVSDKRVMRVCVGSQLLAPAWRQMQMMLCDGE
jgi:hypothetical protein